MKKIVEVKIGFNIEREVIEYVKSDFMDNDSGYKDPIDYTVKLISMGLEKFLEEHVGIKCPECNIELDKEWSFCPGCGWNSNS